MPPLDDCDALFLRFFDHWYSDGDRQRRGFPATKPDMFTLINIDRVTDFTESSISPLNDAGQTQVCAYITAMEQALQDDWPGYLGVSGDIRLDWIQAFDEFWDQERIAAAVAQSDPTDLGCQYIVVCCELAIALGYVLRALQPRLVWYLDWPYWESMLVDPKTGVAIPVFDWAIKKMSSYGVDDGLVGKVRRCLEVLDVW